jgi:hypothetical protein
VDALGIGSPAMIDYFFALHKDTEEQIKKKIEQDALDQKRKNDRRLLKESGQMSEYDLFQWELDEEMEELRRKIDRISSGTWWVSDYFIENTLRKFEELGGWLVSGTDKTFYESRKVIAHVDNWFEDSEYILALEVRPWFTLQDLSDYKERLELIRRRLNSRREKRKLVSVLAVMENENITVPFEVNAGVYVFMQSYEDAHLMELPSNWTPKEFADE